MRLVEWTAVMRGVRMVVTMVDLLVATMVDLLVATMVDLLVGTKAEKKVELRG